METIYITSPDGFKILFDRSNWIRFSNKEKPIRRQPIAISDIAIKPIWSSDEESPRNRKFLGYEIRFESGTIIFIKLRVQGNLLTAAKNGHFAKIYLKV